MIREQLRQAIKSILARELGDTTVAQFSVEAPEYAEHGDYATNAGLVHAKILHKNPMELAEAIARILKEEHAEIIAFARAAAPGFVNITLADGFIARGFANIFKNPEKWSRSEQGKGKTAMVEYFQLNIAKRPHIGHIRSAIIGDALKRILLEQGYHAVSDTHVGDWGTQFGILLHAYKNLSAEKKETIAGDPFDALNDLYIEASARIKEAQDRGDESLREEGKKEFAGLEQGDAENRKIWQWMVDVSMEKLKESADRLGLLPFDEHRGESAYENAMPPLVEMALAKGVAKKTDDNAVVVDLEQEGLGEAVLIKSDGASTYLLRDLATIQYRKERWDFWKNIYVVDVRQSHHFRQVFRVAELLGLEGAGESVHVELGFVKLPGGAMSTRAGNVIALGDVMEEAETRAREAIKEKNPDLVDSEKIAKMIGLGALKYFDLSHSRRSDITFRWEDALSFEGNTGPYLQYTHARLKSILRKSGEAAAAWPEQAAMDATERALVLAACRLPEAAEDAIVAWSPHLVASYLYTLAQMANEFYHSHPVLQENDPTKQTLRLALVNGVSAVLKRGLYLLGIEAPEEM